MKRVLIIVGAIVILALAYLGYRAYAAGQADPKPAPATAQPQGGEPENVIWASGKLLPQRWADLSPAAGGLVKALRVAEGERVAAGALLVELESGVLRSQADAAAAAQVEAEAARAKLLAPAAKADLAAAQADVSAAQTGLAQAQAALKQAQESATAATAQVTIAQAQYDDLASRPTPAERLAAQRQIDLARLALEHAQRAYDAVRGDPDLASRPEALALQQATSSHDAAKAAYAVATEGATPQQLAVGRAQIAAAQAQAAVARSGIPPAETSILAAQAQIGRAQAMLERLQAGPTAEDRAMAEARVKAAEAGVATARAQLAQAEVRAPFAGQIGALHVRPGELVVPGMPVLTLGDTTKMHVETTDLRETDVARIAVGMGVEVTFDALPGRTYRGTVARIAPMSNTEKGSTNYTVGVDLPDPDAALRWGMTAFVNIRVDK